MITIVVIPIKHSCPFYRLCKQGQNVIACGNNLVIGNNYHLSYDFHTSYQPISKLVLLEINSWIFGHGTYELKPALWYFVTKVRYRCEAQNVKVL